MHAVKASYAARLDSGALAIDAAQAAAIEKLDHLADALTPNFFPIGRKHPRGLYIWGSVGRGKSMLMDLFFEAVRRRDKRRVHFHDFMLEIHAYLHAWRQLSPADRRRSSDFVREAGDDPIAPAAKHIADQAGLLCFDEFHVTQIADAMILGRLFSALFDRGVVVVATSNRKPDDLYENGINRQLFTPFIHRLRDELDVIELDAARDYRLDRLTAAPVYYSPLSREADGKMDEAFSRLADGAATTSASLDVQGRKLHVARQAAGVARFDFSELCARPLGAADYLAIARRFHTVFIDHVPVLSAELRNEAARFVTLIDALYESRTKLIVSAAAEPDALYTRGDGRFEFQRAASRLHEMRSADYLAAQRAAAE